ncbi:hypothetical protein MUB05_09120 [Acinetobacter indicus]|uniref:hypothetical protein n=1 Tax=Acinetobacter TaxID=469 RepID=UPI0015D27CE0|nr:MULTISPECIES: hypothetical protein [Acinetobacter]MCP0916752.1 hypothetical protein [Acinetobacter indicus]MCP0919865.1 hypothetical protein [Acinetobacter indicus]MCP0922532.1 hypothetical protein [Acinetobacter indicus]
MKIPYPIKDYFVDEQYDFSESLERWRWEFIRRNPEYQAFYEKHKNYSHPSEWSDVWKFGLRGLPDPKNDMGLSVLSTRVGFIELPTYRQYKKEIKKDWYTHERYLHGLLRSLTEFQSKHMQLAVIDLSIPIDLQIKKLKEDIKFREEYDEINMVIKNYRFSDWKEYLKILDAKYSGLDESQIAEQLYPEVENIYPDYSGKKRIIKALQRSEYLINNFATGGNEMNRQL